MLMPRCHTHTHNCPKVKLLDINNALEFYALSSQDYDAIIKLVETLNDLPTCLVAKHQNIKFTYIFALNRYP